MYETEVSFLCIWELNKIMILFSGEPNQIAAIPIDVFDLLKSLVELALVQSMGPVVIL